jgi:hypothetical protein
MTDPLLLINVAETKGLISRFDIWNGLHARHDNSTLGY